MGTRATGFITSPTWLQLTLRISRSRCRAKSVNVDIPSILLVVRSVMRSGDVAALGSYSLESLLRRAHEEGARHRSWTGVSSGEHRLLHLLSVRQARLHSFLGLCKGPWSR